MEHKYQWFTLLVQGIKTINKAGWIVKLQTMMMNLIGFTHFNSQCINPNGQK